MEEASSKTSRLNLRIAETDRQKLNDVVRVLQHSSLTAMIEWIANGHLQSLFSAKNALEQQLQLQHQYLLSFTTSSQVQLDGERERSRTLEKELECLRLESGQLRSQLEQARQKFLFAESEVANAKKQVTKLEIQLETLKRKGARLRVRETKSLAQLTSETSLNLRKKQVVDILHGAGQKRKKPDDMSDSVNWAKALDECGLERILSSCTETLRKCVLSNPGLHQSLIEDDLVRIREQIGGEAILRLCDEGLSDSMYNKLVQLLKSHMREVGLSDRCCPLPPLREKVAYRACVNEEVSQLLNIQELSDFEHGIAAGTSFRIDVYKLLETLITVYRMEDQPTIHIKLQIDETPFYGDRKLERASIKIMNYALDRSLRVFKIQSENELFPISLAYVDKENKEALTQQFRWLQPLINDRRMVTSNGRSYELVWHLACDLKATKILLGLRGGAMGDICTICTATYQQRSSFETDFPKRNPSEGRILNIDPQNVHLCTMHMEVRITERMVREELSSVWARSRGKLDSELFEPIIAFFRSIGINKSLQSEEVSGVTRLKDLGFKDTEVRRIISHYREFIIAVNHDDQGRALASRRCWKAWDFVASLLRSMYLDEESQQQLLHILFAHAADLTLWGAPAIWNTQGMEKQHLVVKRDYSRLSQRGGKVSRSRVESNELRQLLLISGRRLLYRLYDAGASNDDSTNMQQLSLKDLSLLPSDSNSIDAKRLIDFFALPETTSEINIVAHGSLPRAAQRVALKSSEDCTIGSTEKARLALAEANWTLET